MATATLTSKGQITIPLRFREAHGFLPNTNIDFVEEKRGLLIVKSKTNSGKGRRLVEHMRGRGDVKLSTDEIMRLTRGEI